MNLGEQIMQGGQSYGGGWNLENGLWTLENPLGSHCRDTLEDQNMGLCGGYGVLTLVGGMLRLSGCRRTLDNQAGKTTEGWI